MRKSLRHIVDPYDGNYKAKVTIPKNFSGVLLIAGLSIAQLRKGESIFVRFKFGRNLTSFVSPAWVGPAAIPGLTSTTTIDVLHVNLSQAPFSGLRLTNYHLYDYNQYAQEEEPVIDPFDDQLYCRALSLDHDPTFAQSFATSQCTERGERCLYAYAQVFDQGLYVEGNPPLPSELQFALGATGVYQDESPLARSKKCLADNGDDTHTFGMTLAIPPGNTPGPVMFTTTEGVDYRYHGPYEARSMNSWQITSDAVVGADGEGKFWGLFEQLAHVGDGQSGFYSLKFPRAGRLSVRAGIQYIGQDTTPTVTSHPTRGFAQGSQDLGQSQLMDGCNLRVAYFDSLSQEGIDACDVTALIELVKWDSETRQYLVLEGISETRLKVQLLRSSEKAPLDASKLVSSKFRTCNSNSGCGGEECCYNNRCWSRDIVTQCLADDPSAQLDIGESCRNDMECQSLCCSGVTGTCQGHDGESNLCSKSLGATCIADEFCGKVQRTQVRIIKTGINPSTGQMTCERRPFNMAVFANCIRVGSRGICQTPPVPEVPAFDPENPDCSNAEDPPQLR